MTTEIQQQGISRLLQLLPDKVCSFQDSQYPLPIKATFLGDNEINISPLHRQLIDKQDGDVKVT